MNKRPSFKTNHLLSEKSCGPKKIWTQTNLSLQPEVFVTGVSKMLDKNTENICKNLGNKNRKIEREFLTANTEHREQIS